VSELAVLLAAGGPEAIAAREALERLAEDDSRAVAAAALAALGRPPTTPVVPEREPEPEPEPEPPRERRPVPWRLVGAIGAGVVAVAVAAIVLPGGSESPSGGGGTAAPYAFSDARPYVTLGAAAAAKEGQDAAGGVVLVRDPGAEYDTITAPDPQDGDRFGTSVASADFDDDGRADLAVGAPGRRTVTVLYGLDLRSATIEAGDVNVAGGAFAFQLVARDFDDDGYGDLLIGSPGSTSQTKPEDGSAVLVFGSKDGLRAATARALEPEQPAGFGFKLAAGDINDDGDIDVVASTAAGLELCPGAPDGPTRCRDTSADQSTSALTVADVNDDGKGDVIQGDETAKDGEGVVRVWRNGLDGAPTELKQGFAGVPGSAEAGNEFGHDVVAADVTQDRRADIVVAARGDGTLTLIPGLDTTAAVLLDYQAPSGQLGATLTLMDVDDDDVPDLFAGVKAAADAHDALVEFRGREDGFEAGKAIGPSGLVTIDAASPLRLGR
jgi:hypothetical protein